MHYHYSNSYSEAQQLLAKIWYGHDRTGRTASDGLVHVPHVTPSKTVLKSFGRWRSRKHLFGSTIPLKRP